MEATQAMIHVQMCTKRATPTGDDRDTDITWATKGVKQELGEEYAMSAGPKTFVSQATLSARDRDY